MPRCKKEDKKPIPTPKHFLLREAAVEYARNDERIKNVYYCDDNGTASFAIDYIGDGQQIVQNLYLIMDRISMKYSLRTTTSDAGAHIVSCGDHIYSEEKDSSRGRKPKQKNTAGKEENISPSEV